MLRTRTRNVKYQPHNARPPTTSRLLARGQATREECIEKTKRHVPCCLFRRSFSHQGQPCSTSRSSSHLTFHPNLLDDTQLNARLLALEVMSAHE